MITECSNLNYAEKKLADWLDTANQISWRACLIFTFKLPKLVEGTCGLVMQPQW